MTMQGIQGRGQAPGAAPHPRHAACASLAPARVASRSSCCPRPNLHVLRAFEGNGSNSGEDSEINSKVVSKTLMDIQKNMLAINTSRVKMAGALQAATEALAAKEELLEAKEEALAAMAQRIEELEQENETLKAQKAAAVAIQEAAQNNRLRQMSEQQAEAPPAHQQQQPLSYTPYPPHQQQQQQYSQQQQPQQQQQQQPAPVAEQQQQQQPPQQQQQQAPPPPQQQQPAPPGAMKITYITGWHDTFIHYSVDGKSWTNAPGLKMKSNKDNHSEKFVSIEGSKLEFVFNDGHNNWDSPGAYSDKPKNYHITTPGTYRIKSGKMERTGD